MEHINSAPDIIKEFLIYTRTIQGKSAKTSSEYYFDLRLLMRFIKMHRGLVPHDTDFEAIDISDVDVDFVRKITLLELYEFLNYLSTERGDSPRTRARKISAMRSYFKYLCGKMKYIENDPTEQLETPRIKKSLPRYLTLDECMTVLRHLDKPGSERDFAIFTLFLNCGMRLSELASINVADINGDTVRILGKGNKERTIYLNDACISAVSSYLAVRPSVGKNESALFLNHFNKRLGVKGIQWMVEKRFAECGLSGKKLSVHKLRHTAATLMYKYGNVDLRSLQEILGHEQLSTTQIYTHVDDDKLRSAVSSNPLSSFEKTSSEKTSSDGGNGGGTP